MSKMNFVIELKGYEPNKTSNPSFVRNAQFIGIDITDETIQKITIAAGGNATLFSVIPAEAKKFIYLESTKECDITINGVAESTIKPIVISDSSKNGVFFKSSDLESVAITNNNAESIEIYYITSK